MSEKTTEELARAGHARRFRDIMEALQQKGDSAALTNPQLVEWAFACLEDRSLTELNAREAWYRLSQGEEVEDPFVSALVEALHPAPHKVS